MDIKQIAKDSAKVLMSYLTYQAMRTVLAQLDETNPPLAYWLHKFSSQTKIQDGEAYLTELFLEKPDLGIRILTVREHLAQEVMDSLPEMVRSGLQDANMQHRKQHLERMTQLNLPETASHPEQEPSQPNLDNLSS
ncbi:MAG TPA: chaperonin family protein RbcX [Halomicronema sp.]